MGDRPHVVLLTPTCDQPFGLRQCERYVHRQTAIVDCTIDWTWIVIDDGLTPAVWPRGSYGLRRRREPDCTGAQSLCRNLLLGLSQIPSSATHLAIIEHDDWYAPTYLATALSQFTSPDHLAVGDARQRYYHVGARCWREYANRGASLCQTVMRRAAIDQFAASVEHNLATNRYGVDGQFWTSLPQHAWSLAPVLTVVGLKGLPGRMGLGVGHRPDVIARWTPDPEMHTLRRWIGDDDVAVYADLRS